MIYPIILPVWVNLCILADPHFLRQANGHELSRLRVGEDTPIITNFASKVWL